MSLILGDTLQCKEDNPTAPTTDTCRCSKLNSMNSLLLSNSTYSGTKNNITRGLKCLIDPSINGIMTLSPVYTTSNSCTGRAGQYQLQYWTVSADRTITQSHHVTYLQAPFIIQTLLYGKCSNTQKSFISQH